MKSVTDLIPTISESTVAELNQKQQQKEQAAAEVVNKLFKQLKAACPAMFHTLNGNDEITVKRQWTFGFIENGINPAMINAGMRIARQQSSPFMPSVGQFIEWCEKGLAEQYGLLTPTDLVKKLDEYCACRGFDDFCDFDYGNNANYWLINDLYRAMQDENLSKAKLPDRAKKMISEMAKKLMNGYVIPSPTKSLPKTVKGKPLTRDQQLLKLNEIKRKFGFGYAAQQVTTKS